MSWYKREKKSRKKLAKRKEMFRERLIKFAQEDSNLKGPIKRLIKRLDDSDPDVISFNKSSMTRKQKEKAIAGKIPPNSKSGRGKNREIMLTGDMVDVTDRAAYETVKMRDLTDKEIEGLYNLLVK